MRCDLISLYSLSPSHSLLGLYVSGFDRIRLSLPFLLLLVPLFLLFFFSVFTYIHVFIPTHTHGHTTHELRQCPAWNSSPNSPVSSPCSFINPGTHPSLHCLGRLAQLHSTTQHNTTQHTTPQHNTAQRSAETRNVHNDNDLSSLPSFWYALFFILLS